MSDETIFYILGGILAVSAVVFTFAGLKLKNFPGRALPVAILWFAVLAVGATTYSVFQAQEHEEAHATELHEAGEHIEETEEQPHEDEAGAQGGETEELEEEAEEEAEGPEEEEPVGPTEGEAKEEASGAGSTAGASVFAENCAGCHGEDGHGGPGGPDLTTMPLAQTEEGTVEQVTSGGGGMPAFGEQLSDEEISDVAAFVVQDVVGN
ncbi:MAG TPA: c-type cytochrome [Solirubrobacterales bacterium]